MSGTRESFTPSTPSLTRLLWREVSVITIRLWLRSLTPVRSFGTEDRPTDRPMAPREEEYEYIIFRATDLKDIRVLEPPNPQATLQGGLASDPAIVKVRWKVSYLCLLCLRCLLQHSKGGPVGSKLGYGAIGSQSEFALASRFVLYITSLFLDSPENNRSIGVSSGDLKRSPRDDSGGSKNRLENIYRRS